MKKVSKSFVTGAIALVFGVLGYQTALLVHYAAVTRIVANADCPDTVYVYPAGGEAALSGAADVSAGDGYGYAARTGAGKESRTGALAGKELASGRNGNMSGAQVSRGGNGHPADGTYSRRSGSHSEAAKKIRSAAGGRRVESFRFDPNTVSTDDLQRLGFSEKQAASIENYRSKGGRFRRKEDFAASYVVSDSVYARLEKYIDIPKLDINKADSAAFDTLPGIGGYFARKMVEYRSQLHGYSFPEQLMDIYRFDREKYDALKDLIEVGECEPYPLWTLPADSLRLHPYIRTASVAKAIVLFRTHNPASSLSVQALVDAGIIYGENAEKLSKCIFAAP